MISDPDKFPVKKSEKTHECDSEKSKVSHHSMFFVATDANLPLNCSVKPVAGETGVVVIGEIRNNCPFAATEKIKDGAQVCYINSTKIEDVAQVAVIKKAAQEQGQGETLVWTFSNWRTRMGGGGGGRKVEEAGNGPEATPIKKEEVVGSGKEGATEFPMNGITSPHVSFAIGTATEDGGSRERLHKKARVLSDEQVAEAKGRRGTK